MKRRWLPLAAAVVAGVLTLTSCSGTVVTSSRLDHAVGPAFARLYLQQQRELGSAVVHQPDSTAQCSRTNATSPASGAGDDWVCVVNLPFPDGHVQPINYDLKVAPTGCYTASGPTQVIGQQQQRTAAGGVLTNPLFEFDGCFPT